MSTAGGGACEIALSRIIMDFGKKEVGLDQYAIAKFAQALEVIPCALADTSGTLNRASRLCRSLLALMLQALSTKLTWEVRGVAAFRI